MAILLLEAAQLDVVACHLGGQCHQHVPAGLNGGPQSASAASMSRRTPPKMSSSQPASKPA